MTAIVTEAMLAPPTSLERAQQGSEDAFAEIVTEHQSMVFGLAYHFFQDRDRAREIAQDVFLQLFRRLRDIETPAHLVHWLRQVTSRRCIDQTRRSRLHRVSLEDAGEDLVTHDRPADPFLGKRIREHVATLPELQRITVTLRYQEDLSPTEIAEIVKMPVNTVKSHLHRALLSLRRKLGEA